MNEEILPKEIFDFYTECKEKIRKGSEYIIAYLDELKDIGKRDNALKIIHREIGVILKSLDYIKSFGVKEEKDAIEMLQEAGSRYNSFRDFDLYLKYQAEIAYWASRTNTVGLNLREKKPKLLPINIDFTLFRILSPDFKVI